MAVPAAGGLLAAPGPCRTGTARLIAVVTQSQRRSAYAGRGYGRGYGNYGRGYYGDYGRGYYGGYGLGYGGYGLGYLGGDYWPYDYGSYWGAPYYYGGYSWPYWNNSAYVYPDTDYYSTYAPTTNIIQPTLPVVATRANVEVIVPNPQAKVWFDDTLTNQSGNDREFQTPALTSAGVYHVRASWMQDGHA